MKNSALKLSQTPTASTHVPRTTLSFSTPPPLLFKLGLILGALACGSCNTAPTSTQNNVPWDPRVLPAQHLEPGPIVTWPRSAGGNGHSYQAIAAPNGINWADAQALAVAHGGYLATLTSAAENAFVFNLVADPKFWKNVPSYTVGPWLGGAKSPGVLRPTEGWQWVNHDGPFAYTNWASG